MRAQIVISGSSGDILYGKPGACIKAERPTRFSCAVVKWVSLATLVYSVRLAGTSWNSYPLRHPDVTRESAYHQPSQTVSCVLQFHDKLRNTCTEAIENLQLHTIVHFETVPSQPAGKSRDIRMAKRTLEQGGKVDACMETDTSNS